MHIGKMIHDLRKDKKMTLSDLSKKSGIAIATLSRIENEKMVGTLQSHVKICKIFKIPLSKLYESAIEHTIELKRKRNLDKTSENYKNISSQMLITTTKDKKMIPISIRLNKDSSMHKKPTESGIEKFIYVVAGDIDVIVGEETYTLSKDNALYFDSSVPHCFKNTGSKEAHLIYVMTVLER